MILYHQQVGPRPNAEIQTDPLPRLSLTVGRKAKQHRSRAERIAMAGKVAIVGAGLIGRSWAIVFARGGHEVALYDADAGQTARALETIAASLADMAKAGLVAEAGPLEALIRKATSLGQALEGAAHVQENVAERREVKRQLFAEIDRLAAKTRCWRVRVGADAFAHFRAVWRDGSAAWWRIR